MAPLPHLSRFITKIVTPLNFGHAALLVDDRRHEAKINFGRAASRLRGLEAL